MQQKQRQLALLANRLLSSEMQTLSKSRERFYTAAAKLDAISPLKVISRGYSVVQTADGEIIPSVKQTAPGDNVHILFRDGTAIAKITCIKENDCEPKESDV